MIWVAGMSTIMAASAEEDVVFDASQAVTMQPRAAGWTLDALSVARNGSVIGMQVGILGVRGLGWAWPLRLYVGGQTASPLVQGLGVPIRTLDPTDARIVLTVRNTSGAASLQYLITLGLRPGVSDVWCR